MTKFQAAKRHIELRETFYEINYKWYQRIYAHAYMMFYKQEKIEGANVTLEHFVKTVGTVTELRKQLKA